MPFPATMGMLSPLQGIQNPPFCEKGSGEGWNRTRCGVEVVVVVSKWRAKRHRNFPCRISGMAASSGATFADDDYAALSAKRVPRLASGT